MIYIFIFFAVFCFSSAGGWMCLCSCTDGSVLVYRGAATGYHCSPACCALSTLQNHGVQRCRFQVNQSHPISITDFTFINVSYFNI